MDQYLTLDPIPQIVLEDSRGWFIDIYQTAPMLVVDILPILPFTTTTTTTTRGTPTR